GTPQLILPKHFSPSLWQQSSGHSLLLPGGVSNTPGIDCPRVGSHREPQPPRNTGCDHKLARRQRFWNGTRGGGDA
ncbi:unnamed protein product, partial [Bubo scandiacus]